MDYDQLIAEVMVGGLKRLREKRRLERGLENEAQSADASQGNGASAGAAGNGGSASANGNGNGNGNGSKRIEGELPASPDDSAWNAVDRFWVPLSGQIIVRPRWFSPAVTGVWVQGLHNGTDLTLRVTWNDRSNSPDTVWGQWRTRVTRGAAEAGVENP